MDEQKPQVVVVRHPEDPEKDRFFHREVWLQMTERERAEAVWRVLRA